MPGGTCGLFPSLEEHRKNNPITNADCIRAMSDKKLAKFIAVKKGTCPRGSECIPRYDGWECEDCWLDWLKSKAEVE